MNDSTHTVSVIDATTYSPIATIPVGSHPHGFGEFICPGVPRLLIEEVVGRLQAVQEAIAASAEGVNGPTLAHEHVTAALAAGRTCLQESLWSAPEPGKVDLRRLQRVKGAAVFASSQTMVEAILDALRRGWTVNAKLEAELLAIVDEVVRADRVLAAVVIDDAIVAKAAPAALAKAQQILKEADALVKEAALWQRLDKKSSLLRDAIGQYQKAWDAALGLVP